MNRIRYPLRRRGRYTGGDRALELYSLCAVEFVVRILPGRPNETKFDWKQLVCKRRGRFEFSVLLAGMVLLLASGGTWAGSSGEAAAAQHHAHPAMSGHGGGAAAMAAMAMGGSDRCAPQDKCSAGGCCVAAVILSMSHLPVRAWSGPFTLGASNIEAAPAAELRPPIRRA